MHPSNNSYSVPSTVPAPVIEQWRKQSPCAHRAYLLVERTDSGHVPCAKRWWLFIELGKDCGGDLRGRKIRSFILDMLNQRCRVDVLEEMSNRSWKKESGIQG